MVVLKKIIEILSDNQQNIRQKWGVTAKKRTMGKKGEGITKYKPVVTK